MSVPTARRRPWAGRIAAVALGAVTLAAPAPAGAAAPAAVDDYPVPASRTWAVSGHGWGHGYGLSQEGAQERAKAGQSATAILDFYYPGTASAPLASSTLRVVLTRQGAEGRRPAGAGDHRYECDAASTTAAVACTLAVVPAAGLTLTDAATGAATAVTGGDLWRVRVAPDGLHVDLRSAGVWSPVAFGGRSAFAGPLRFRGNPSYTVGYGDGSARVYRGDEVDAVRTGSTTFARVLVSPMDSYLRGVVPRESPSYYAAAALQAQAVAARSYAANLRSAAGPVWDICDSTYCQVFGGSTYVAPDGTRTALEAASTDQAVAATGGYVRTYGGSPIFAQFSSSNGGWTRDGGAPYLKAAPDPYDAGAYHHDWTATLSAATVEAAYPGRGRLVRMVVVSRDGNGDHGGRVATVRLDFLAGGTTSSVTTSGDAIRQLGGLRSNWFWADQDLLTEADLGLAADGDGSLGVFTRSDAGGVARRGYRPGTAAGAAGSLGGFLQGGPSAASDGAVEVAAGRGGNDAAYVRSTGAVSPSGWRSAGGRLAGRPAVTVAGTAVSVVAPGVDGQVWLTTAPVGGAFSGAWASLGGAVPAGSGVAAAAGPGGDLLVAARGSDGALWVRERHGGAWSSWQSLGGAFVGDPAVAVDTAGGRVAVVRATNGAAYTRYAAGPGAPWTAWTSLGGRTLATPATAATGSGVELVVIGGDGTLWRRPLAAGRPVAGWSRLG